MSGGFHTCCVTRWHATHTSQHHVRLLEIREQRRELPGLGTGLAPPLPPTPLLLQPHVCAREAATVPSHSLLPTTLPARGTYPHRANANMRHRTAGPVRRSPSKDSMQTREAHPTRLLGALPAHCHPRETRGNNARRHGKAPSTHTHTHTHTRMLCGATHSIAPPSVWCCT